MSRQRHRRRIAWLSDDWKSQRRILGAKHDTTPHWRLEAWLAAPSKAIRSVRFLADSGGITERPGFADREVRDRPPLALGAAARRSFSRCCKHAPRARN